MNKGLSLLGLAFRSGNLVSGEFAAREAVRKKTAALIIVANDASDNTKRCLRINVNIIKYLLLLGIKRRRAWACDREGVSSVDRSD